MRLVRLILMAGALASGFPGLLLQAAAQDEAAYARREAESPQLERFIGGGDNSLNGEALVYGALLVVTLGALLIYGLVKLASS